VHRRVIVEMRLALTLIATVGAVVGFPDGAQAQHSITVDTTMLNNDFQSAPLCEASCFSARFGFSTVPFVALDLPTSVTLVYDGDRAFTRPFLHLDVTPDNSGVSLSRYALSATVNGAPVTFVNGDATLIFSGAPSKRRLTGQFVTTLGTGVYSMVLTVIATYADNGTVTKTINTELMIVDQSSSPVARGWSIASLQRLYFPSLGGYMIADGDGSAVRFRSTAMATADYSTLSVSAGVYTRTYPDKSRAVFNATGLLTSMVDRLGRSTTFDYDGSARLVRVKNPMTDLLGAPYDSLTYGSTGLTSIIQKKAGSTQRTTAITIGSNGSISALQDPDGVSTLLGYDTNNRLSSITDRKGAVTTLGYDALTWKLASATLPQVPIDAGGGNTSNANPIVRDTAWQSVGLPRIPTTVASPATPAIPDSVMGIISDPLRHRTRFTVNRYGQPLAIQDPLGTISGFSRSGIFTTGIAHPDGSQDIFTYSNGLLTSSYLAGESLIRFHYDSNNMVDTVSGLGVPREVHYNNSSQLVDSISIGQSPARVARFTYDPTTKRVATAKDPLNHQTSFSYGNYGNTSWTSDPSGRISTRIVDTHGRDSVVTPSGSRSAITLYDAMNRATAVYDSLGATPTTITYNPNSLIVTDRLGQSYKTDFDALGRSVKVYNANSTTVYSTLRYDSAGRMTSTTNRRGQRIDLKYDVLGRVTAKSGTNTSADSLAYIGYTGLVGWNTTARDTTIQTVSQSRTDVSTRFGGSSGRFFVRHNDASVLTAASSIEITSPVSDTIWTRYYNTNSSTGLLASIALGSIGSANFTYNTNGDRIETDWVDPDIFSPVRRFETWKPAGELAGTTFSGSGSNYQRTYTYDAAGRIVIAAHANALNDRSYAYDRLGRIRGVGTSKDTTAISTQFTYDAVGNRTDHGGSYGTGNRVNSFAGYTFEHDADGNVTRKYGNGRDWRFYWSAESRLDSVSAGGTRVGYRYDAHSRLTNLLINGAVAQRLVWDGDHILAQVDGANNRIIDYSYEAGIDAPLSANLINGNGVFAPEYFVRDELGNVLGRVGPDGSTPQVVDYDAWGSITSGSTDGLAWKSLFYESNTQLYYVRNRWYDPEIGRFLSEDPIGLGGGLNQYAFGGDDPINRSDPTGLQGGCAEGYVWGTVGGVGGCIGPIATLAPSLIAASQRGGPRDLTNDPWFIRGYSSISSVAGQIGEWFYAGMGQVTPLTKSQTLSVSIAIHRLLNTSNMTCRQLGVAAFDRLANGRYFALNEYNHIEGTVGFARGAISLDPSLFLPENGRGLVNSVAHEEFHYKALLKTIGLNDQPGHLVYQVAAACQAAAF
jgi:RHS repeat-associated protein